MNFRLKMLNLRNSELADKNLWIDEELDKWQSAVRSTKELSVRGKTQKRVKSCLRSLNIGRAHAYFYMAGNKGGISPNITGLKFWGLSCSQATSKMELVKFMKRIM